jgi:SUMO ligase MMS21 Smc5/6 complex component
MTIITLITTYPVSSRKIVGILGSEVPGRLLEVIVRTQQSIEELLSSIQRVLLIQKVVQTQTNSLFPEHISGKSDLTDKIQSIA